jgi:hypothetical protein
MQKQDRNQTIQESVKGLERLVQATGMTPEMRAAMSGSILSNILLALLDTIPQSVRPQVEHALELHISMFMTVPEIVTPAVWKEVKRQILEDTNGTG